MEFERDWKQELKAEMDKISSNKKDDWVKIINLCEEFSREIQEHIKWISEQSRYVENMKNQYIELYRARFEETPPTQRPQLVLTETSNSTTILKTRAQKRDAIHKSALAISQPNSIFSANDVNENLIKQGISLDVKKPQAVISTILVTFEADFKKIAGRKKGMFTRIANV